MKIEEKRMEALLWGIIQRNEKVIDRLLDAGVELPEVLGDFYITINGIPACLADLAVIGRFSGLGCQYSSLRRCIQVREKFKAIYPGAVVAVIGGCCPSAISIFRAA